MHDPVRTLTRCRSTPKRKMVRPGLSIALTLLAAVLLGPTAPSNGQSAGDIDERLGTATRKLEKKRRAATVLTTDINRYNRRINSLQQNIDTVSKRVDRLTELQTREQAELDTIRGDLRHQRARLGRLRQRLNVARKTLADRLVELYEAPKPDLVTIVVTANGFTDLIERAEFLQRIADSDRQITLTVRAARDDAQALTARLDKAENRQTLITERVETRREAVASSKQQLVNARTGLARARGRKQTALQSVRGSAREIASEVKTLRRAQARIERQLRAAQTGNTGSLPAGPLPKSDGQMIWPVNGPITSPYCERRSYESCHPGIDIGVPEGTPIRAAASGRVVLMQPTAASGGYGNYTCVQHTATLTSCYAHQSRFGTTLGATVTKGQTIGYVGNTGHSFGAHLHWEVRINGTITNPLNYV